MIEVLIRRSNRKNKKYMAIIEQNKSIKTIHFGQKDASDYTIHKDKQRRERYIKRHQKREDWTDIYTAGFWSRWLLWNKPTIKESKRFIEKKFNIIIK